MAPVEWLLLVTLSVLWGGSFFFAKVAVAELPPFTVVLARVALAALALLLIVLASGQRLPRSPRLGRVPGHGRAQQSDPVQPDRLGPDRDRERPRLDPERDHAAVRGRARPCPDPRRAADARAARGRARGARGRRRDDRAGIARAPARAGPGRACGPRSGILLCARRDLRPALPRDAAARDRARPGQRRRR